MQEAELQVNRLNALAESAQLFAEASTDLARLLGVIARRFSELVGEAANIRLIEGDALIPVATFHPDPEINRYLLEAGLTRGPTCAGCQIEEHRLGKMALRLHA